jgi:tetratricopeptide (TPR) repeat protein
VNQPKPNPPRGPIADSARLLAEATEFHRAGRLVEAERIYRRILHQEPANPDALHLLGLVARQAGQGEAAIRLLRQAIANNPDAAPYRAHLAMMYEEDGRYAEAGREATAALKLDPWHGGALHCLANAQRAQDRYAEAVDNYQRATRVTPDDPALWSNYGATLQTLGRDEEAAAALRRAVSLSPAEAELHSNLGNALLACGLEEEGLGEFRESLRLDPAFAPAHTNLASALLQTGRAGEALDVLQACLERHPGDRRALAYLAAAAHECGDDGTRARLMDYGSLMAERRWSAPAAYDDLDAFNAALVDAVTRHPTLQWEPASKSTRKGSQTGELAGAEEGPLAVLEEMVKTAMGEYLENIPSETDHPFLATAPDQWKLTMWATVLDRGGHQAAHVHPTGWLSGVYYAAVPAPAAGSPDDAGWIEFGRAPDDLQLSREASVRTFEPAPGLMLLFPSYFYHRTLPFTGDGQRVSIAFDLMPLAEASGAAVPGQLTETELAAELERVARMLKEMRVTEAVDLARRLVASAPDHAHAAYLLGLAVHRQGSAREAADLLSRAVELAPDMARYRMDLGACYSQLGDFEGAVRELEQAIELDPGDLEACMRLATLYSDRGEFELCAAAYEKALERDPTSGAPLYGLSNIKRLEADDPRVLRQIEVIETRQMEPLNEAVSCFAVARTLDQADDLDRAMQFYHRGNRRKRELSDFSIEAERANTQRIIDSFGPEVFERFAGCGDPTELPVFIVGMPRSGTTLVEQILSSHPAVHGAGELNDLWRTLGGIGKWLPEGRNLPEAVAEVDPAAWAELGQRFVKRVRRYNREALRITDKLPFNYTLAGIIRIMLPQARIIHCVRDPRDTCVSCYTTSFQSDRGFTCDMSELGETYRLYWKLMTHWRQVLPGGLFEMRYESLVDDLETEARGMVDYLGLEWSDDCLDFHQNPRRVLTASMTQVRQPAYRSSMGRWRRYEDHIQPLLAALGDLRQYGVGES